MGGEEEMNLPLMPWSLKGIVRSGACKVVEGGGGGGGHHARVGGVSWKKKKKFHQKKSLAKKLKK